MLGLAVQDHTRSGVQYISVAFTKQEGNASGSDMGHTSRSLSPSFSPRRMISSGGSLGASSADCRDHKGGKVLSQRQKQNERLLSSLHSPRLLCELKLRGA